MNDRERKIEELFKAALVLDEQARASLLRDRSVDEDMRHEVEALLRSDQCASQFLHRPYLQALQTDGDEEYASALIGKRIGNYLLKKTLGLGGMGAVFEAEQDQPRRTVALKLMRQGVASRSAMKRFRYEVEILGSLQHPNVAQVYEAGVHDDGTGGVPYFAMEHIVDALPITKYAQQQRLPVAEKLKRFAVACDAIHHGHQKGILHRDIKPANVLVDSSGKVKIIDFGVAKATNVDLAVTTQQTDFGQLLGTIQYMSPEQCSGQAVDVDIRSDVYSLGVLLYELLAGNPPYDTSSSTLLEATRTICEEPPRPLAERDRSFRGDLETIVSKALEKEPARRYQSASALADDVRRHLGGEPIAARPASRWLKAMRWVSKHPVATTGAVCFSIIGISLLATWLSVWYLAIRPDRIELSPDGMKARLISKAGHELRTWSSASPRGIGSVEFVKDVQHGSIALIGYGPCPTNPYPGSLVAYDASSRAEKPLWVSQLDMEDLPESLQRRGATPSDFRVGRIMAGSFFTDHGSTQLFVSRHFIPFSQCVFRIYDLNGDVLYQAWHDGSVGVAIDWLPEIGAFVTAGDNGYVYWEARNHPKGSLVTDHPHPVVVFAFRPEFGLRSTRWISPEPMEEPTIEPIWYRCLLPPDSADRLQARLQRPITRYHPDRHVVLVAAMKDDPRAAINFVLDEHGNEIREARVVHDPLYRRSDAPNPNDLYLADLPPIREK